MDSLNYIVEKAGSICNSFPEVKSWDVLGGEITASEVVIEKGFLKTAEHSTQYSINIRLFGEKGKTGSVNITNLSLPFLNSSIEKSIDLMKGSLPNWDFKSLSHPADNYPNVQTPYDSRIKTLSVDDMGEIIDQFMNVKVQDERIISVSGNFSSADVNYFILNSNGVNLQNKASTLSLSAEITMEEMIKGNKENSVGFEGQSYVFFTQVEAEEILGSALTKAKMGLTKSKISTDLYPVILPPQAVMLFFNKIIASAANAQAIYENRSFLRNQVDKQIASEQLEITDNPWLENGMLTFPFDMEGTPTRPQKLVENGVLKTYLHNTYTANLFETVSTGHASRSLGSSVIGIQPSNLLVRPGNIPFDHLIEDIKTGVYLEASYDSPNFVTGEFSGMISAGYLIEEGIVKNALRESLFGMNLLDFYNNISGIGKEISRYGSHYAPFMKIDNVKISSKK